MNRQVERHRTKVPRRPQVIEETRLSNVLIGSLCYLTDRQDNSQTDTKIDKQTDRQTETQTDIQTNRRDRQNRQADRQTTVSIAS